MTQATQRWLDQFDALPEQDRAEVVASPEGLSATGIIQSYPSLTAAHIQAALAYAADLAQERVLPLPA